MTRIIPFTAAILEATDQCMAHDSSVYVMGLGDDRPQGHVRDDARSRQEVRRATAAWTCRLRRTA